MWGALPLGLKVVLGHMDPLTVTWYRFSISAIIALAWYGWRSGGALRAMLLSRRGGWALTAVFGLLGNYVLFAWGLDHLNPGAAQIIVQVAPLLLLLASIFFLGERVHAMQWLGVAAFSIGLLLFFHRRLSSAVITDDDYLAGAAIMLGAAGVWAIYAIAQKKLLVHHHAKDILLLICLGGSLCLLPVAHPEQIIGLDHWELALLLFCGVNTILAYGAFGLALSYWDASRVSAMIPLVPLLTLSFTYLLNRWLQAGIPAEPLDRLGVAGAVFVVVGSMCATLSRRQPIAPGTAPE